MGSWAPTSHQSSGLAPFSHYFPTKRICIPPTLGLSAVSNQAYLYPAHSWSIGGPSLPSPTKRICIPPTLGSSAVSNQAYLHPTHYWSVGCPSTQRATAARQRVRASPRATRQFLGWSPTALGLVARSSWIARPPGLGMVAHAHSLLDVTLPRASV